MNAYQAVVNQVNALASAADAPTTEDRAGEYKRIFGIVVGAKLVGGITDKEMLKINRDLADLYYMYDSSDIAERNKVQDEARKDEFLAGAQ